MVQPGTMMGSCYFSLVQWQELELQALIFRHMIAGAAVPPELLHLVKKSLVSDSSPYCIFSPPHSYYAQYHSALMQTGYWGRTAMDPEPGRCRRTDGKKWRCSRDVVVGQKYCERHMHRGKNRSRKPVENPTSAAGFFDNSAAEEMAAARQFCLSGPSPPSVDLLQRNQRPMEFMNETKCCPLESLNDGHGSSGGKRTLIPFFDDWPRSIHETATDDAAKMVVSATSLSISIPGNPSSDVSLKLGTCKGNEAGRERPPMSWSTGGPLAEALRSSSTSASTSSPISVLQNRFPRSSVSENSC